MCMGEIVLVLRFEWDDTICLLYKGSGVCEVKCFYGLSCRTNIQYKISSFKK
jgi:hypothetical protein